MRPKFGAPFVATSILVLLTINICSANKPVPVSKARSKGVSRIFRGCWPGRGSNSVEKLRQREEGNPGQQQRVETPAPQNLAADSQTEHVQTPKEKCIISADKEDIKKLEVYLERVYVKCHAKGEDGLAHRTDFEPEGDKLSVKSQSTVYKVKKKGSVDDGVRYAQKHYKLCPPGQVHNCITHKQFVEEVVVGAMMFDDDLFVSPLYVFVEEDQYYLITEWIDGGDLTSLANTVAIFHVADIRPYARLIAEALATLHSKGVIHRDVKMDNVLLGGPRGLKLGDFGSSTRSKDKTVAIGTPDYWAPELFQDGIHTKKVDAWAYGVVLLQMAIGENMLAKGKRTDGTPYLLARDSDAVQIKTSVDFPTDYPLHFELGKISTHEIKLDLDFHALVKDLLVWDPHYRISIEGVLEYSAWLTREPVDYEQLPFEPGTRENRKSGKVEHGYYYRGKQGNKAKLKKIKGFIRKRDEA